MTKSDHLACPGVADALVHSADTVFSVAASELRSIDPFGLTFLAAAGAHGYGRSEDSFNVKRGRCEACQGDGGGRIIAQGTPEDVAAAECSYTGRYLRPALGSRKAA